MQLVGAQQASDPMLSVRPFSPLSVVPSDSVRLRCIACESDLTTLPYHSLGQEQTPVECVHCFAKLTRHQGIWLALLERSQRYFARFMRDYELVREAEGRGSSDPEFYLSLPFQDRTGRNSWQWSIISRTLRYFVNRILTTL
jgi:hypothetical protein